MASNASTFSNVDDPREILIEYGDQRRPISFAHDNDLNTIQREINNRFEINIEQMNLQIQWYDDEFKEFVDLDNEAWPKYKKNQEYERNKKSTGSQQRLKLVHKGLLQQHHNITEQQQIGTERAPVHRPTETTEQKNDSQHWDQILETLRWVLPLFAVFAYIGDAVWLTVVYDPESEEQQNYAGLTSTIFILFYYLQYDVKIDSERRKLWIPYQTILFLAIEAGDILYTVYYRYRERDLGLMIVFIIYTVIDAGFVICVGYLKYKRKLHVKMEITKEAFFHLMSRLEVLLIVLIPLYANYDVISTNSIAFFILYDLFSHFYDHENLTYRKWSLLSFWSLIFFATVTVIFENVEFICTRLAYSAHEAHDPSKEKLFHTRAQILKYTNNGTELLASIACYTLILLQFFTKSNNRNKTELDNTGNIQQ